MSWAAGDLAECVEVRDLRLPYRIGVAIGGRHLKLGMVYIVQRVCEGRVRELHLDVGAPHGPKLACRFRKVPPLADEELAEAARELADG